MMEQRLEFDIEIDVYFNGILVVTCPQCRRTQKRKLRSLQPGSSLGCPCGTIVRLNQDDFGAMQKSLDDLKRARSA